MSEAMWTKRADGRVMAYGPQSFSVAELEEGLRVAKEKPVFEARDDEGALLKFQKREGRVKYSSTGTYWHEADNDYLKFFNNDELEAILNARRS